MADENKQQDKKQETAEDVWAQAVKRQPMLQNIPQMVQPQEFTVEQSMQFDQLYTFFRTMLHKYGQPSSEAKDPDRFTLMQEAAFGQMTVDASRFFRGLAADKKAFDKWTRGKDATTLSDVFSSLLIRYMGELGK